MKHPAFILIAILLFVTACGGGGNPVIPDKDLSGLIGTWDVTGTYSGELISTYGPLPISDTVDTFWIIDATHVAREDGSFYTWTYDGVTLELTYADTRTYTDVNCGDCFSTGQIHLIVPIKPGAKSAHFTGSQSMTLQTEYCGDAHGPVDWSGNVSKR